VLNATETNLAVYNQFDQCGKLIITYTRNIWYSQIYKENDDEDDDDDDDDDDVASLHTAQSYDSSLHSNREFTQRMQNTIVIILIIAISRHYDTFNRPSQSYKMANMKQHCLHAQTCFNSNLGSDYLNSCYCRSD